MKNCTRKCTPTAGWSIRNVLNSTQIVCRGWRWNRRNICLGRVHTRVFSLRNTTHADFLLIFRRLYGPKTTIIERFSHLHRSVSEGLMPCTGAQRRRMAFFSSGHSRLTVIFQQNMICSQILVSKADFSQQAVRFGPDCTSSTF